MNPQAAVAFDSIQPPQGDPALRRALLQGIDLLQGLQQHRGLGGQTTSEARQRCQTLGASLDHRWKEWPYAEQRQNWQALRRAPADFDGHCRLLQDLLATIQHLELHRCALNLQPPSIAERCWELEDLGRLRGLSVRAAAHRTCPLEMLIQLQYLHERLLRHAPRSLHSALDQLQHCLIDTRIVSIAPAECYALLTPLLDERLDAIRRDLD
ncbi:hypothetical protein QN400_11515 [Pseudomonas sp. RTC3]|uniref:hypothetical protein n=1 Tax=unclassified Pseudomonas TaxID=196821 RepID=UPI002AB35F49|nr:MULTISPECIES: hypothetical protein [unclassified Pseudomonas]MEB0062657.1 hypothetical protein [Pseudomonas sp. RTC3]MDY7565493.1 hypothetical protein [Pseudomonas sp. 5C2]MEB0007331.1 hypothetical protein [Pseudomonas sp. RTB2]MEB0015749.1 hypothetical protein [Pseudomonas sp. RTB3]MEB0026118.1 hypothetical protein [Pseudomonas sp. MH9.2]